MLLPHASRLRCHRGVVGGPEQLNFSLSENWIPLNPLVNHIFPMERTIFRQTQIDMVLWRIAISRIAWWCSFWPNIHLGSKLFVFEKADVFLQQNWSASPLSCNWQQHVQHVSGYLRNSRGNSPPSPQFLCFNHWGKSIVVSPEKVSPHRFNLGLISLVLVHHGLHLGANYERSFPYKIMPCIHPQVNSCWKALFDLNCIQMWVC